MKPIAELKCAYCGAPARFDPATGKLQCDHCGASTEIPQETELEGFDFDSLRNRAARAEAEELPVYSCVSCGAEVIAPAEQMALTCPYCRNNIVLTEKASGSLRPDGVLPFQIPSQALPAAVKRFYRGKKLLPRGFFENSRLGEITGVYVPFWVFSGQLSGRLRFAGERSSSFRRGDYIVTETSHYQLDRDVRLAFSDIPVDASGRIDDALMDSLEPFDMDKVRPFDMRYLAGFTADRFDRPKDAVASRAERRMRESASGLVRARVGGGFQNVTAQSGRLQTDLDARYLLFPVYLFDILHRDKAYRFAVNGQTGEVVGSLPVDPGTCRRHFLLRAGLAAGALMLFSFVKYMLGY